MKINDLTIIFYPVLKTKLAEFQERHIIEYFQAESIEVTADEINKIIKEDVSQADVEKIIASMKQDEKNKAFQHAKKIVELLDFQIDHVEGLAKLGRLLQIGTKDTGFDFDLYNEEAIVEFEFKKAVRKFSLVSGAIGFIPLPIADFAILSSIQIGLIAKISNIYKFKIEPQQFLKMVGGTLGAGFLFRVTSKVLCNFVPLIGWGINAAVAYAGTYAIGILAKSYIKMNGELTKESVKIIWDKAYKEGKTEFGSLKDYLFKKKDELLKEIEKYREHAEEAKKEEDKSSEKVDKEKPKSDEKKSGKAKTGKKKE